MCKLILFIFAGLVSAASFARERVAFVTTPEQAYAVRTQLIEDEKVEINADLNIVETSGRAGEILAKLCARAKAGVKVRLVTDGLAAHFWKAGGLTSESALKTDQRCGSNLEIRFWNPVEMNSPIDYLRSKKLRRDHDKIMIFRGQNIVYTGDRNSQNVNYRDASGYSYLSIDAVTEGQAATTAAAYFDSVWALTVPISKIARDVVSSEKNEDDAFELPFVGPDGVTQIPFAGAQKTLLPAPLTWINAVVRFAHYDPRERLTAKPRFLDTTGFNQSLLDLIRSARSELIVSTPFLRLPKEFFDAIKERRHAGVRVTLVTSRYDSQIIPKIQTQNRDIKRLQNLNVELEQKASTDDLHAKLIIADGERVFLGSHNFNMRGSFMDLEAGVFIDDPRAAAIVRAFALDITQPYVKRRTDVKTTLIEGALKVCSYCQKQF